MSAENRSLNNLMVAWCWMQVPQRPEGGDFSTWHQRQAGKWAGQQGITAQTGKERLRWSNVWWSYVVVFTIIVQLNCTYPSVRPEWREEQTAAGTSGWSQAEAPADPPEGRDSARDRGPACPKGCCSQQGTLSQGQSHAVPRHNPPLTFSADSHISSLGLFYSHFNPDIYASKASIYASETGS